MQPMRRPHWPVLTMLVTAGWVSQGAAAGMSVTLTPSLPGPVTVGTVVRWTASVSGVADDTVWYRFRAGRLGQAYKLIRDYSPLTALDWTAADHEGWFEIEVSAQDTATGQIVMSSATYEIVSRVVGNQSVVNPTSHPLVFLFSSPPCATGSRMQVQFVAPNGTSTRTPFAACDSQSSMNFYLAGLYAESQYTAHHIIQTGTDSVTGPDVAFTTGSLPGGLFTQTVIQAPAKKVSNQVLLGSATGIPVATDMQGSVIWYGPADISIVTRPEAGGVFWGILGPGEDPSRQSIRKFDAVGRTLLETNAARVNQQLARLGRRKITAFHHEVRTLPGGRIAALADVEQILTDVQGPGPIDVIGDMIVVFDSQLNVIWTWDTFDWLDVTRKAVLGETCSSTSCAPHVLAPQANDWTHGNSLSQTPDGNLLYSSRHQDWLIKVNYDHGRGDGHVIWRLGKDGDFDFASTDTFPWFSHQHDANFEAADPTKLMVFDDGNTRVFTMGSGNSRGQILQLNEQDRIATPVLNADLGIYSVAVGSAQKLRDGNYFFDAGFVRGPGGISAYSIEVDPAGKIVSEIRANTMLYRSFRMTSLYAPN